MQKIPSPALVELLERDGELDKILDGRGLTFYRPVELGPPAPPPQPFIIPPADWHEEERQLRAAERKRERQQRSAIVAEELARIEEEAEPDTQALPARRRRKWRP